jgi:hypothetical protein
LLENLYTSTSDDGNTDNAQDHSVVETGLIQRNRKKEEEKEKIKVEKVAVQYILVDKNIGEKDA